MPFTAHIFCITHSAGNVSAFDKYSHPNHQFANREARIGPNFKTGFVIDKDKAAIVEIPEEEMQLPSEISPSDHSPKNSNIASGSARQLNPSLCCETTSSVAKLSLLIPVAATLETIQAKRVNASSKIQ